MARHGLMIATCGFIVCTLCVPGVKNYAKQSQFVRGPATGAGASVQNKANSPEAGWTLTADRKGSYAYTYARWLCEKQSQFSQTLQETPCGVTTSRVDQGYRRPARRLRQTKPISRLGECAKQSQFALPDRQWAQPTLQESDCAKQSQFVGGPVDANCWLERELCVQVRAMPVRETKPILPSVDRNALRRHYEQRGLRASPACETAAPNKANLPGWAGVRNKANLNVSAVVTKCYENIIRQTGT